NSIIYPKKTQSEVTKNQIFLPVRYKEELYPILAIHDRPLLLHFTNRGDRNCNKLTGPLYKIIINDLEDDKKKLNLVDIECDTMEQGIKEIMLDYNVNRIPSIIAVNKSIKMDEYIVKNLNEIKEIDWNELRKWVESVA
ncbi:uncharacterized protein ASCRUDRAFT_27827, partial [Ascoidea rubescens DSM 1968]